MVPPTTYDRPTNHRLGNTGVDIGYVNVTVNQSMLTKNFKYLRIENMCYKMK